MVRLHPEAQLSACSGMSIAATHVTAQQVVCWALLSTALAKLEGVVTASVYQWTPLSAFSGMHVGRRDLMLVMVCCTLAYVGLFVRCSAI